jgi:hypothetical protein
MYVCKTFGQNLCRTWNGTSCFLSPALFDTIKQNPASAAGCSRETSIASCGSVLLRSFSRTHCKRTRRSQGVCSDRGALPLGTLPAAVKPPIHFLILLTMLQCHCSLSASPPHGKLTNNLHPLWRCTKGLCH